MNDDLISRKALIERPKFKRKISDPALHRGLESAIAQCSNAPAVDSVEVVRCKECKHCSYCGIKTLLGTMDSFGYCPRGKRRERRATNEADSC